MFLKMSLPLLVALAAMPVQSNAAQCSAGSSPVTVSGRVTTLNVSATKQVGQICMTMVTPDGREVFDECGAVVGKVTSSDPATGASTLNHLAAFEKADTFYTVNDAAQVTGVLSADATGVPCAFSVLEHITDLRWGTGVFQKSSMDVWAVGSVSFCPDKNLNTFQLDGQGCLPNKSRR